MARFETILQWCQKSGARGKQVYDGFMRCKEENAAEGVYMDNYYPQTTKVHLKCENGHEMYYTLQRIKQDAWCRKCRWVEVNNERFAKQLEDGRALSLADWCKANGERGEEILRGYKRRETENIAENMNITKIHYTSSKSKMHFQCDAAHDFDSFPYQVSVHSNWCPDCAKIRQGKAASTTKISKNGSFYDWIQEDARHRQYILDGFMRCREQNKGVDLSKLPKRSIDVKIWMSCENDAHAPWKIATAELYRGRWCPYCGHKTSFPEQILYFWCVSNFKEVYNRYNFGDGREYYEADIYIKDLGLVIEYQGQYYHKNRKEHDLKKLQFFKSQGLRELEILGFIVGDTTFDNNGNLLHNCQKDVNCSELIKNLSLWFKIAYDIDVLYKDVNADIIHKAKAVMNK